MLAGSARQTGARFEGAMLRLPATTPVVDKLNNKDSWR